MVLRALMGFVVLEQQITNACLQATRARTVAMPMYAWNTLAITSGIKRF
jgi:hypothetical protein